MKNENQKTQNRTNSGAFRAFSSYLRIGAVTVASSVRSAASAIADREIEGTNEQVLWAGFDKLEIEKATSRKVLLLAYKSGFQIWDVEEADNITNLVSNQDGTVAFLQAIPKPILSKGVSDKFSESRPLLAVCADSALSGDDPIRDSFKPSAVWFYSLGSESYVHVAKFRSVIYSVRCSCRVVAVQQAAQIHCLNATTLEKEYTILTNPILTGPSSYGPLAVGPRWLAYSGTQVSVSITGRVATSASYPPSGSNGSLVAHYAKESSKQLAAGIVTLGDIGYKKLSRYYSELVPDSHNSLQNHGNFGHFQDAENVGMVIVREIVSKALISQFRAHKSPISSLRFDPSGTLLVTASIQGHNINVFRINPVANSNTSDKNLSYVHLYRLQRGVTNAVIQDISFSNDSHWIMISSSRGTNHLFSISPFRGPFDSVSKPENSTAPPVTLSVVGRIRSGNSRWTKSAFSGAIASAFHSFKADDLQEDILVFSCGSMVQYALKESIGVENEGPSFYTSASDDDVAVVEAVKKWDICLKNVGKERGVNSDIYGENGNFDRKRVLFEEIEGKSSNEKTKSIPYEKVPIFISEAELQMHEPQVPLWAKSEIYFQCMIEDGGEKSEIERIPTRVIEAKPKYLIPVFDYLKAPKSQPARISNLDNTANKISRMGSASSHDSMNGIVDTNEGIVNSSDHSPKGKTRVDFVNNRANATVEPQIKLVNNIEGSIMEKHVEDKGVEFD